MNVPPFQRHFDYVAPAVALGAGVTRMISVPMATSQEFLLRAIATTHTSRDYLIRVYRAGGGLLYSADGVSGRALPTSGVFWPVFPQESFPADGMLQVELTNTSLATNTIQVVFRGVTIEPAAGYDLPAAAVEQPWIGSKTHTLATGTVVLQEQSVQLRDGLGFFIRSLSLADDLSAASVAAELFFTLRDLAGRFYSNDWVPASCLFGSTAFGPGAGLGALCVPIFVPGNGALLYNIRRADATIDPCRFNLAFAGGKIVGV